MFTSLSFLTRFRVYIDIITRFRVIVKGFFKIFNTFSCLFFRVHLLLSICTPAGGLCVCLACVLCALLRLCGCDRLPSVSVVPSVCPVGSAAVPPGIPTQGATGRPPAPPFSTFRVPKIRKTKLFSEKVLTLTRKRVIMKKH